MRRVAANAVRRAGPNFPPLWVFRHSLARRSRAREPQAAPAALSPVMDRRRAAIAVPTALTPPAGPTAMRRAALAARS